MSQDKATGRYGVNITLAFKPTDEIIPQFSKTITVSNNSMTGFEVTTNENKQSLTIYKSINAVI